MKKSELMNLPISISSWIILRDYFQESGEINVLLKMIGDYYSYIPLYEIYQLFTRLENAVEDSAFQGALDFLFRQDMIST